MERASLLVAAIALLLLGTWELVMWPHWALSQSALFLLLGHTFRKLYTLTELASAGLFVISGLFGVYFAGVEESIVVPSFEIVLLLPLTVLFTSAAAFVILGSELMAHNRLLTALTGKLWKWRFNRHSNHKTLAQIEETFQCCGWGHRREFAVSRFCRDLPKISVSSCAPFLLNHSGKSIYRQGLVVSLYSAPLLLLVLLVVLSHKKRISVVDVEEAELLDQRRKQVYSGEAPAIQLQ